MDEPKLVVLHKFLNPNEAHIAKNLLEDAEIQSFLLDEHSSYSIGTPIVLGGYRLAISDQDWDEASEILKEFVALDSVEENELKIRCPKCHSSLVSNKVPFSLLTILGLIFSSLFIMLSNSSPRYHCKRCKYKWNENKRV